jgi:hypothetical protein
MRFLLTEKKGCSFHNFFKEKYANIYKLKILFIDYNNIFFKFKNEHYSLIRIEKNYFDNKERRGINGYRNIIVLIIKSSKLCIDYSTFHMRPYENSNFYNFENKKEYGIITFKVDGFKLKRKGLNFIEDKLKWIYKTVLEKLNLNNDEEYLIDNL